ncbi:MAG: hypothetical protein EA400_16225 [Chromatiaceae bacterium]|nr:MAG: hypothetical protein EA400_16225 [Chromatiaceae bacterium]
MALANRNLARIPAVATTASTCPADSPDGSPNGSPHGAKPTGASQSGDALVKIEQPKSVARFFRWREAWNLGIASLDRDHRRLAALLDRIAHLADGSPPAHAPHGLMRMLDTLGEETRAHFAHEEALMHAADYPHYAAHKAEHDLLMAEYTLLVREVAERAGYLIEDGRLLRIRPRSVNPPRAASYQPTASSTAAHPVPAHFTGLPLLRPARFTLDLATLESLKGWFLGHLLDDDRHFARYLHGIRLNA